MKKIFVLVLILLIAPSAYAAELKMDEATKAVCNQIIINIYQDILKAKEKHHELADFGEDSLYENEHGLYAIVYKYEKGERQSRRYPYEFGVTIVGSEDKIFFDKGPYAFNLMFPLLKLKFAGYEITDIRKYKFQISELVNRHGLLLAEHQQKYMPLRMQIKPVKSNFYLYEQVQFEVLLTNVSNQHMWVKGLDDRSLYCLFNNKRWGTQQLIASKEAETVLKSGQTMAASFIGEEITQPKDVEIYCSYNMNIKGVHPSASLKISVIDK